MPENQSILNQVREAEKKMGFTVFEDERSISEASAEVGSLSKINRERARRTLDLAWEAQPEVDANSEKVKVFDMVDDFENAFPDPTDRGIALTCISNLEFTGGCNGGCDFCYFGKKKGISRKYSYESIVRFMDKYGGDMNRKTNAEFIVSYCDTDLLDWKDVEADGAKRGAVDIYRIYKDRGMTKMLDQVTTSVPRGTQREFVDLMKEIIKDKKEEKESFRIVRLSLGKHNARRIESCLIKIKEELVDEGMQDSEVEEILQGFCIVQPRSDEKSLLHVGDHILESDPYSEISTVHGTDGVVLSPNNISNMVMVASTVYNPSGTYRYEARGQAFVEYLSLGDFQISIKAAKESNDWKSLEQKLYWMCRRGIFLHDTNNQDGNRTFLQKNKIEYSQDDFDKQCLWISRRCLSLNHFIELNHLLTSNLMNITSKTAKDFYEAATKEWESGERVIKKALEALEIMDIKDDLSKTKKEYFTELLNFNKMKVSLVLEAYKENPVIAMIIAPIVKEIGLDHKDKFQEIFEDMSCITDINAFIKMVEQIDPNIDLPELRKEFDALVARHNTGKGLYFDYLMSLGEGKNLESELAIKLPAEKDITGLIAEAKPIFDKIIRLKRQIEERMRSRYGDDFKKDDVYKFLNNKVSSVIERIMIDQDF